MGLKELLEHFNLDDNNYYLYGDDRLIAVYENPLHTAVREGFWPFDPPKGEISIGYEDFFDTYPSLDHRTVYMWFELGDHRVGFKIKRDEMIGDDYMRNPIVHRRVMRAFRYREALPCGEHIELGEN